MQPSQKKKYSIQEFLSPNRSNPIIKNYTAQSHYLQCFCNSKNQDGFTCFKCKIKVHTCLAKSNNRGQLYECVSCLNQVLDLLYQVKKVLIQSYFRTESIFDYHNIINFEFNLAQQDLGFNVEVRGIIPGSTVLGWPMQGAFILNDEKNHFYQLKPLLANSNRKARRQQYFTVPKDKLKLGKNFVRFKIPCLDKNKFTLRYQFQDKKVYYMSVNLVVRLSSSDLQTQTFKERRCQKKDSMTLLKQNNCDIEVVGNKVCLICPYTRERIKVPVRGRYCKHFSCICLETLIVTHSSSRHWGCPICQTKINEPYVDVWIYNMLRDNHSGSQVMVTEDGNYEWINNAKEAIGIDSQESQQEVEFVRQQEQAKIVKEKEKSREMGQNLSIMIFDDSVAEQPIVQNAVQANEPVINDDFLQIIQLDVDSPIIDNRKQNETKKSAIKNLQAKLKKDTPINKDNNHSRSSNEVNESKKNVSMSLMDERGNQDRMDSYVLKKVDPIIFDVILLEMKEMRIQELKKTYFRGKVNRIKKNMIKNQQLHKLFKQIL